MKSIALPLLVAAALTAASVSAEETAPPKRYPPSSVRLKLVVGGAAITGLAYGAGFLAASSWPEAPGAKELKIPVVGPWLALAKNDCSPDDPDCGFALYFRGILTVIDGLAQLGGLGIALEGVIMTTEANGAAPPPPPALTLRPAPVVTASGVGMGVVGTF